MSRFACLTLIGALTFVGLTPVASANGETDEGDEAALEPAGPATAPAASNGSGLGGKTVKVTAKVTTKVSRKAGGAAAPAMSVGVGKSRRRSRVAGFAVPESSLREQIPEAPSGHLKVVSIATHEEADVQIFNEDGSYNLDALHEVDHILRCKRTDTEKPIEPRLYVVLSHVYDHFGKPLEVVSGFRNQRRQTSFHFKGSASDIRITGVPPKKVRDFADSLDAGGMGIGLYPRARFVHIDIRPLPSYRWIDNARPNPNSPDKRPPRGWKRKKLQS